MKNSTLSQLLAYTLYPKPELNLSPAPRQHANGVKNSVRPMFKQNKRAESKRLSRK